MEKINVNFQNIKGEVKPMHGVNNGPVVSRNISNVDLYQKAGIPFARVHDSVFCSSYGGPHCVDIYSVFPNFDADAADPNSYDFELTDEYLMSIDDVGTEVFYRLGSSIEHYSKKYYVHPPKNYLQWAKICEGIIRHYTEGWANGMKINIRYWEIWNEPDLGMGTWTGTDEQFFELYETAAVYLKKQFPHLKIGGIAITSPWNTDYLVKFLEFLSHSEEKIPLDFFSWHGYGAFPTYFSNAAQVVDEKLKKYGYNKTESICNEWNYIRNWEPAEEILYSYKMLQGMKGAAFISATMSACQKSPVDIMMYYDARPSAFNGMFSAYFLEPLKGYYSFVAFNELYKLGNEAESTNAEKVFSCAATDGKNGAVLVTYFEEDDDFEEKTIHITICGIKGTQGTKISYYLLDDNKNLDLVKEEVFKGDDIMPVFTMVRNTTMLLKVVALE